MAPFLIVELARDDGVAAAMQAPPEGIRVVVQVSVRGFVPRVARDGIQAAGQDNLKGLVLTWGDGVSSSWRGLGEPTCVAAGPLVEVDMEFVDDHVYGSPGRLHVTFETSACEPVGSVRRTLVLTVA